MYCPSPTIPPAFHTAPQNPLPIRAAVQVASLKHRIAPYGGMDLGCVYPVQAYPLAMYLNPHFPSELDIRCPEMEILL